MGNYFMLPRQPYWNKEVLLSTPNKNYTVRDYAELFTDLGHPKGELLIGYKLCLWG